MGIHMVFVKRAIDIARREVVLCEKDDPVQRVAQVMRMHNIGSVVVMDRGVPAGIITVNDILDYVSGSARLLRAEDIMKRPVICVGKDTDVEQLAIKFHDTKSSRILLEDEGHKIVGTVRDVALDRYKAVQRFDDEAASRFFARDGY